MELGSIWVVLICIVGALMVLKMILLRVNGWLYERKLGELQYFLPPGDLGWPFIGNMWSFLRAFKSSDPDSFMGSFITRYGRTGIYKAFMFGRPSVFVTTPETCKRVLLDDDAFKPGWPRSAMELIGKKSFIGISFEEHKRLRRLTASPVNGHEALSVYLQYIEENVVSALKKWATMGQIEFLTEIRKVTFRIIMYIFLGSESEPVMEALEREYTALNYGVRAMAINLPGFAYHKALKARKNLVAALQSVVDQRRKQRKGITLSKKKDMMDALMDVEDENGRKLSDEEIIDILLMYLNAGHESSGHIIMWATIFLQEHPEFLQKAKEEQEEIIKRRPPTQKGLTLKEVREMEYLSKVIDETLRMITFSLVVFREAKSNVNINGYIIPKGWKVLVWFRSVHLDSEVYPKPREFNPSRWDNHTAKAGTFLPFGAGSRMCPGNDLAKLEIAIFLHHFLLKYELERVNPGCSLMYLPHSRPKDNCLARIRKIPCQETEVNE
ncbi:ent-kaurenoic acid oxidase 2 [Manihot esculenta]|uniref:Ent-kaurenoic acid oxidase n=3 Tax=Manihot esculenta TaxID=3983 RepID=A0A251L0Y6_MANES|nr:ent-kaurenoic acid oxidase 2 [Manihot esculenta]XP_021609892.1 ent-kaurenoic acid oxidase 2 [Manihot esculenta]XP_021609893.1 ent-kaurenoic acid oxidase 2 [Manihot esculenta]XP_021609894.1 ent-kaurenoic acid oxidase 2 [Manihot esculenta]XP_021609895.1 ent-kaurenoic acid oxidase 2 [Manihot esculenta]XP_021609896.1 ent-kaurenoic acid oxidase 2 [Manihot esculenta]XP_043811609.1 ent-kaurenoic acid oxidase 2 [Manihot esculenta]XP_043811610.1 ent-kaurenoic acid oxidase 2 [Manihot esculenta]XP_